MDARDLSRPWRALLTGTLLVELACTGGSGMATTAGSSATDESSSATTSSDDTTTTGDATATTADDATSAGFVPPKPDLGAAPSCDIFDPASCPPGEKCTSYSLQGEWDATGCFPIMGSQQPGDLCTAFGEDPGTSGLDDCDEGSMCWNVDAVTHEGYCVAFCGVSQSGAPTCEDGHTCPLSSSATLPLCLRTCDPLLAGSDCQSANETCVYANPDPVMVPFACVPGGEGAAYGDACMRINDCDAGLYCTAAAQVPGCATPSCCSEFCDLNAPNTCAGPGQVCEGWVYDGMVPSGYEHVGGCGLP